MNENRRVPVQVSADAILGAILGEILPIFRKRFAHGAIFGCRLQHCYMKITV